MLWEEALEGEGFLSLKYTAIPAKDTTNTTAAAIIAIYTPVLSLSSFFSFLSELFSSTTDTLMYFPTLSLDCSRSPPDPPSYYCYNILLLLGLV